MVLSVRAWRCGIILSCRRTLAFTHMFLSLQAGRAAAAVLVMLFHLGGAIAADKYFAMPGFAKPFAFGDCGVEFFFVLSGFIIFSAHRGDVSDPAALSRYLTKRFLRIFPSYWIIFVCV